MSVENEELGFAEKVAHLQAKLDSVSDLLKTTRTPSKAHLIGVGRSDPYSVVTDDGEPGFFTAIAHARSRDATEQQLGKAQLSDLGSRYVTPDPGAKATLGDTDANGGFLVPNNLVASFVEYATAASPARRLFNTITGVSSAAVDLPYEDVAPTRALVIMAGATKTNLDFTVGNYTATLYTLAQIYDASNQLLRHSASASEQLIRSRLGRGLATGEMYYTLNGSGSGEPLGLLTAMTGTGHVTAHTASDSTVAGSVRAAIAKAVQALSARDVEPDAVLMNPGDLRHAMVQGADTAGFWNDTQSDSLLGLPAFSSTLVTSKTAVVGSFKSATLYIGQGYRVDVSTEAGTRWDRNVTGFRAEEEIGFNAAPAVVTGNFQRITGLIP